LDIGLSRSQNQPGRYGDEKDLTPAGIRTPAVQSIATLTANRKSVEKKRRTGEKNFKEGRKSVKKI
jgi:hypothetical protein